MMNYLLILSLTLAIGHAGEYAASTKQIASAPCKSKSPPGDFEMKRLFEENQTGPKETSTINGVMIVEESLPMLDLFSKLTTNVNLFGDPTPHQRDYQTLYGINPGCNKVLCALEKIWGKELSRKLSYLYLTYGLNGSEFARRLADPTKMVFERFTVDEIDDLLMGLGDFPAEMLPITPNNHPLSLFQRGSTPSIYADGLTLANATVTLYDSWVKAPHLIRQYAIFHEMGHNISNFAKNLDQQEDWLTISRWFRKDHYWSYSNETCMVSEYGAAGPSEDFAESVAAYRYNGKNLKVICPRKYVYMKKIFKDREFLSEETCH